MEKPQQQQNFNEMALHVSMSVGQKLIDDSGFEQYACISGVLFYWNKETKLSGHKKN